MPSVRIADKRIWVGEQSRALLHGEVHFWRLSPARWRDVLRSVRELGINVISSYVCWDFHEVSADHFDFHADTDPQRNLVGFIELVAAEGFWLLLRPGPYIYAEWRNSGVPDRVVRYHRSHPEFRRAAEHYMSAVVDAVKPFLATRGGPVAMIQADNEADPWADHYAAQLGLGATAGPFQDFLRERYADVAALNAVWDADINSFDQASAILSPMRDEDMPRYLDVVRFYHHYTTEIVRWTVDAYRRLGIDVPIYTNTYAGFGVQHWRNMEQAADLVGLDVYPTAELRGEPDEHRRMLERVRFSRTYSVLPYIPEFEAGIWHGWHSRIGVLPPNQYRLICLSALLGGIAGWGWYMLVNRDNWMMSPIDELGVTHADLGGAFAEIVKVFRAIDPPSLEKLTDTVVAQDVLQLAAWVDDEPGEAVLRALYEADVDYECFDMETGRFEKRLLFYGGSDWLSRSAQQRLLAYVEGGGMLVFFQDLPTRDDNLQPLMLLNLKTPTGVLKAEYPRRLELQLGAVRIACSSPEFGWYADVPGEPIVAERLLEAPARQQGHLLHATLQVGERYTVGYRERRGDGSIVCLGVAPSLEVVLAIHRWLEVAIPSRAKSPGVSTALFRSHDGALVLIAVNNGDEDRDATISLSIEVRHALDLFTGHEWPVNGDLSVRLPRKSGTAVRLD